MLGGGGGGGGGVPNMLPPLAGLSLGTPTAGNNDDEAGSSGANKAKRDRSDDDDSDAEHEHEHERLDQRAHRKFPTLMPAPETLALTDLPHAVVGIIVEQAAKAARPAGPMDSEASRDSVLSMCTWMKSFCRAANVQGLPCDDDWFRLALGAFSDFVPGRSAMPMGSPFRTWRELFGVLCNTLNSKYHVLDDCQVSATFMRQHGGTTSFWHFNWWLSTSQRNLDTAIRALFMTRITTSLADHQEAVRTLFHSPPGYAQRLPLSDSACAILIMLLMRGANPYGWVAWNDFDVQLYVAIVQGMTSQLPWEEGGEERIRQLLRDGADPSYNRSTLRATMLSELPRPPGVRGYPPVLQLAVYSNNVHLLNALLDAGASVVAAEDILSLLKALGRQMGRPVWWSNERFPVDRATTQRLLDLLMPKLANLETYDSRSTANVIIESTYESVCSENYGDSPNWVREAWYAMMEWAEVHLSLEGYYEDNSSNYDSDAP